MIRGLPRQLLPVLIRVKILSVEANTADRAPRMALASLAFAPARHAPAHHRAGTSPASPSTSSSRPAAHLRPPSRRIRESRVAVMASSGNKNFAIEVERKYDASVVSVDALTQNVESLGGETKGVVTFTDVYYDTPDASLAAKDTWLRARDGAWEIKVPLEGDDTAPRSGGERSVFREVEGPGACLHELNAALLGAPPANDADDARTKNDLDAEAALIAAMKTLDVHPFAKFTTERAKFALDGANVDVDAASFGHGVCEVEVLCAYESQVPDAEAKIAYVAQRLGLTPLKDSGGKLETYIRR